MSKSQFFENEEDAILTDFQKTDLRPEKETIFDSFSDDEDEFESSPSSSKKNSTNDEKNSKIMGLKQSLNAPYSSYLVAFELWDYHFVFKIFKSTYFYFCNI